MKVTKFVFLVIIVLALAVCATNSSSENLISGDLSKYTPVGIPANITNDLPNNPAMAFVRDMGVGINIGNSLDAASGFDNEYWHSGETGWGNPLITQDYVKALKEFGYKSIRLPVTWRDFMGPAPDYLIGGCQRPGGCNNNPPCHPNRMDRVEEVVNWILDEGLYCILNVHHEDWIYEASKNPANQAIVTDCLEKVWKQIAARFAGKSEKLIFESMNEVGFDDIWNRYGGNSGKSQAFGILNNLNQAFVNTVRAVPGNENRFLLIAGYWTDIDATCDVLFKMPNDTVSNRLIVSVHYYEPGTFCIAEERNNSWGFRSGWGSSSDINNLVSQFNKLRNRFLNNGIPVILGEYGVTMINKIEDDRIKWMAYVTQISLNYGINPVLWDTGWKTDHRGDHGGEIKRDPPFLMRESLSYKWAVLNF